MPKLVVDRIEGDFAVLSDGKRTADVPLSWLPADVAEGWHLHVDLTRDEDAEATRRGEIDARRARLSAGDDGGDFSL